MLDLSRAIQRLNAFPLAAEGGAIADVNVASTVMNEAQTGVAIDATADDRAELMNFLDDALQPGCRMVDYAPEDGAVAIHAATAPAGDIRVVVIAESERTGAAVRESVQAKSLEQSVSVRNDRDHALTLDALTRTELANALPLFVHAGEAANIPWIAKGALEAIRQGRIGVIAWRCPASARPATQGHDASDAVDASTLRDADVAATVLAVLGFSHYALVEREGALELVPLALVASNSYVFSVSPEQQAKWSA